MPTIILAIILAFLAGLTTVIGALIGARLFKNDSNKQVSYILGFTLGIFVIIVFHDLIPESFEMLNAITNNFFISLGWLIFFLAFGMFASYGVEKLVPHHHEHDHHNHLEKMSFPLFLALTLHKLPEGMILYMTAKNNIVLALSLTFMIALHHLPEGISLGLTVYKTTKSKLEVFKYSFLSALAVPIGTVLAFFLFTSLVNETLIAIIFSLVSGIMLYILFKEILPGIKKSGFMKEALTTSIIGIIIMLVLEVIAH